jgi:hypothetical protein
MRIPSPGSPVLDVPTITAQKATTTQPNKSKSNAHHPLLKSSDYLLRALNRRNLSLLAWLCN